MRKYATFRTVDARLDIPKCTSGVATMRDHFETSGLLFVHKSPEKLGSFFNKEIQKNQGAN